MPGKRFCLIVISACLLCGVAAADLVTARIDSRSRRPGKLTVTGSGDRPTWEVRVDLSGLPRDARIYRARLYAKRTEPLTGREDWALQNILIRPWLTLIVDRPSPLRLVGPWFDRFDATGVIEQHLKAPQICKGFSIESFPKLDARSIYLDIEYEGKLANPPKQPTGLRVFHRAGQTFITWREMERRIAEKNVTWGVLKKALEDMDAKGVVRYRIYRHTQPITARNIARAECLAEVKPLSCYNVEGRSLERLISMHRRRAIDDLAFARKLASSNYFSRYNIHMPEMDEVVVDRFVIDDSGKPLPVGAGLYVHNPAKAGSAYYAVATCVNGVTNTVNLAAGNATARPIDETVEIGRAHV